MTIEREEWTLAQQGPVLPIGVEIHGTYHRELEVKPWTLREERELGELRDKNKSKSVFDFVPLILATLFNKIGCHDFAQKMTAAQKRLAVQQMFLGDVLYSYIWMRREALGSKLETKMICPGCAANFGFHADIDSIPVKRVDKFEDAFWEYKLINPFIVGGELATTITFGPPRWSVFQGVNGAGKLKVSTILGSTYKVNGNTRPVAGHEFDAMSKRDLTAIIKMLDDHHIGPDLSMELECPHCGHEYRGTLDWSGADFFGESGEESGTP